MKLHSKPLMTFLFAWVLSYASLQAQTYTLIKERIAQLHLSQYKQIAIGDIVGPLGNRTETSMDLADDITSKLFNSNTYEIVERATLVEFTKQGDNSIIDEKTVTNLKKQLKSAVLVTGRVQSDKIDQKLYSSKNGTCAGNQSYYWLVSGEVSMQLKILEVSTGKLIYNSPIKIPIRVKSTEECEQQNKFDLVPIVRKAYADLAMEVTKLLIPYTEQIPIVFKTQQIAIVNKFKKLNQVVSLFEVGDFAAGNAILKAYTEDQSLKPNLKAKAHYNYALGLYCQDKTAEAKIQLKKGMAFDATDQDFSIMHNYIEKEEGLARKVAANN